MEVNKDEAARCIEMAEQYMDQNNKEEAEKFLQKAERLYPTERAKHLLAKIQVMPSENEPAKTKRAKGATKQGRRSSEYTQEQKDAVKRLRACKDFYEILGVSKDATDAVIKKAYKKLALLLHPDKNKYPGSAEAFKIVAHAFAALADPEKRKEYDLMRSGQRSQNNDQANPRFTFSTDANHDELFNMFFGSGLSNAHIFTRRDGRWQRHTETENPTTSNQSRDNQQARYSSLLQILPIVLAILLSLASSVFIADPAYSLQISIKYPVLRHTQNLGVEYFVKNTFNANQRDSVMRMEETIENDYVASLKRACHDERLNRESLVRKARNFGGGERYAKALKIKLPSCARLDELRKN